MGHDAKFDKWLEQWDKASKTESFKSVPKPVAEPKTLDFFGIGETKPRQDKFSLNEVDSKYWKNLYKLSKGEYITEELTGIPSIDDDPLQSKTAEDDDGGERETPDRDELGKKTKKMANTANPTIPSTIGKDQRPVVTGEWEDGKGLREINDMKLSLYKLESKLNADPKFGAFGPEAPSIKNIQGQINDLKEKIDKLSNSLSPDFVADEES